jgi:glucose-6-phosphate isomerase
MLLRHDIEACLTGSDALGAAEFSAALAETAPALGDIARRRDDGSLPLLRLPARRDDLPAVAALAEEFRRRFDHVLVLGTGGSSLGGQTLAALADLGLGPRPGAPRLHFLDNIDPATFGALFGALDFARAGCIAISKSGGTAETLTQLAIVLDQFRAALARQDVGDQFVALTEPKDNPLRRIAGRFGMRLLDHDPGIGGRFSVLSNVGLLPALIAGLDVAAVRAGAAGVLDATLAARSPQESEPARGAALNVALARHRGIHGTVIMPYVDRLAHFGLWFRQLWAESLGKGGKGTTPIRAMGTVDQHSQLQLYLDGPRDKLFTLIMLEVAGAGGVVSADFASDPALSYLAGRSMGDLLDAEQRATAESLIRQGRPVRLITLQKLDEAHLGALFMHFMLETMIAAHLWGVDAFDQPAVEQGKVLARQYLGEMKRSP